MSDYIACVKESGGNQELIQQIVKTQDGQMRGGQGSIAGSGMVIAGKADVKVDTKSEFEMINSIEKKFFPGSMSSCAQALPPVSKK